MPIYILIENIKNSSMGFTSLMLPVILLTTILVTISNIKLLIKEGKTWKNALGVILGIFLCISTFLFITIGSAQNNPNNIYSIIKNAIPFLFSVCITYLECILIGTISIGIVAAKHKPKLNKDYINLE